MADNGGGITGAWDAITNPLLGIARSLIPGTGGYNSPGEQATLENIKSQGYLGQGDPNAGVVRERKGMGALLQAVGILGPSTPEAITPYERYAYAQGGLEHQKDVLGLQQAQVNLGAEPRRQHMESLSRAAEFAKSGGGVMPFEGETPEEQTALQGMSEQAKSTTDLERQSKQSEIDYRKKALEVLSQKQVGEPFNPLTQAKEMAQLPGVQHLLKRRNEELDAITTDPISKATIDLDKTDPMAAFMHRVRAQQYERQIAEMTKQNLALFGAKGLSQGLSPEQMSAVAGGVTAPILGGTVTSPWGDTFGVSKDFESTMAKNPALQQRVLQLTGVQSAQGNIAKVMAAMSALNPLAAKATGAGEEQ